MNIVNRNFLSSICFLFFYFSLSFFPSLSACFSFHVFFMGITVLSPKRNTFSKRVDDGNVKKIDWKDYYLQILVNPRWVINNEQKGKKLERKKQKLKEDWPDELEKISINLENTKNSLKIYLKNTIKWLCESRI